MTRVASWTAPFNNVVLVSLYERFFLKPSYGLALFPHRRDMRLGVV